MRFLSLLLAFSLLAALCFWPSCSGPSRDLAALLAEHDRLDQAVDVVARRNDVKDEMAQDVAAGRRTFREAVACFREAHIGGPEPADEWLAWNVALWVGGVLRERGGSIRDFPHLEPELRRLLEEPRLEELMPGRLPPRGE
jgi:hypothetical protein